MAGPRCPRVLYPWSHETDGRSHGRQERQLAEVSRRLNVPADQLAGALVRDLLSQREADFSEAAARVLEKNRDLYQRLR